MRRNITIFLLLLVVLLISCRPALNVQAEESNEVDIEKCLESVQKYMTPSEAERFCKQPVDCRKWWDDLSDEEKEEMQPPAWRKDPNWTDCAVYAEESGS